jgi:hypothetical protein
VRGVTTPSMPGSVLEADGLSALGPAWVRSGMGYLLITGAAPRYNGRVAAIIGRCKFSKKQLLDMRQGLLELFPVASLRKAFDIKGSKDEIAQAVASSSRAQQVREIADFVDENLPSCKQHVYVFSHDGSAVLPADVPHGEQVKAEKDHALYVARVKYTVVRLEPLKYDSIEFLWPIRIDLHPRYLLLRFVVLEKNVASHFQQEVVVRGKSLSEETVIAGILADGTVGRADLNRGIKSLWQADRIDATRIRYKKPGSIVTQSMDEQKGLKQVDPEAYQELRKLPLHQSVLIPYRDFSEVGAFTADPTSGFIGFTKYFKEGESGDELIGQILKNN